ncbi:MBL fold metallo-hydrolase [Clostridium zeae]|uniref:MBL fold metallo-hydrolase n=1 Tax=Clostridium zeae TaxID=2759022 RepID=A0ABQ1EAS7_9CLOT|nr:MBL fold metallo-hydrolase [Clostridium zeae]GFZ31828.1 MBL fold metallo-hydrolase [Clostridium zeae]
MTKLHILGTGSAMVTKCYNTCFTISNMAGEHFLVDTGGGNTLLTNLEKLNIPITRIHNIFISHTHNDHIAGITWIVRAIAQSMINEKYFGTLNFFGHSDVLEVAKQICTLMLEEKFTRFFDDRIFFIPVNDNEKRYIIDCDFTFFDINSKKRLQYGFKLEDTDGITFTFIGDEPYKDELEKHCINSDFMMHEAFCLFEERDLFKPYEKHHTTVKEACENGRKLNIKNLILIHTEDKNYISKPEYYCAEGRYFFSDNLIVPSDLDEIDLEIIKED